MRAIQATDVRAQAFRAVNYCPNVTEIGIVYEKEWRVRSHFAAARCSCEDAESWHVLRASAGTLVNGSWSLDMVVGYGYPANQADV